MTAEMTAEDIDRFLTCARVGRLGISLEGKTYIVPVGYVYSSGKIFFHTCSNGLKMDGLRKNPNVCFEVDESLSDASMFKSVIVFGKVEIIDDEKKMIPYLQKLIDKYRVPESFDEYMDKPGKNREKELQAVRICIITPKKMTGRKMVLTEKNV
jgi:nitroimidazol reductase NimA-like FMN-containing flavoprotein (pyridoxamine 5'-phosphate oxidase superfamily)